MLMYWMVLVLALSGQSRSDANPQGRPNSRFEAHRKAAVQMNELARHIHSEAQARDLTDAIARMFASSLPPVWATQEIRNRVAHAEYESAHDRSRLIPEQRIADVWNEYVREIGAPEEALVSAAEIHSMRDGSYAAGKLMWARGSQTVWTMPNIYAVDADGKVAEGCRAVETLRILYDLENLFSNLRGARERLKKGVVASDLVQEARKEPASEHTSVSFHATTGPTNPTRIAESRYLREQGAVRFSRLLEKLLNELFPAEGA